MPLARRPASLGLRNSGIPQVGIPAHVASLASEGGMCEQLAADSQHIWFATLSKEAPPAAVAAAPPAGTPVPRDELPELAPTSPRAASPGALKSCLSFSRGCGSPRLGECDLLAGWPLGCSCRLRLSSCMWRTPGRFALPPLTSHLNQICLALSLPCPRAVRSLSFTVDDKLSWQQVFKDAKLVSTQQ